jgi:hypothetical protein
MIPQLIVQFQTHTVSPVHFGSSLYEKISHCLLHIPTRHHQSSPAQFVLCIKWRQKTFCCLIHSTSSSIHSFIRSFNFSFICSPQSIPYSPTCARQSKNHTYNKHSTSQSSQQKDRQIRHASLTLADVRTTHQALCTSNMSMSMFLPRLGVTFLWFRDSADLGVSSLNGDDVRLRGPRPPIFTRVYIYIAHDSMLINCVQQYWSA